MKRTSTPSNTYPRKLLPAVRGYGFAVLSVALALAAGLLLTNQNFRSVKFPFFLFAIAITGWREGKGPGIVALVLSSLAFNYFFTAPIYTLYVTLADLPYYVVFILFSVLIVCFSP